MKYSNQTKSLYQKTIIKLAIIKKKEFRGANVSIQNRYIWFDMQIFFDFKNDLIIHVCHNGKFLKRWDVIAN